MFDLETQIAGWRWELSAGGIWSREVLDELECHLRDDLEAGGKGTVDEEAFRLAVERIGGGAMLDSEFAKVGVMRRVRARMRNAFLTLAGIPNHHITIMNLTPPNLEPRWVTYLKATAFLLPPLFLWTLAAVFVLPKLQQISANAGLPTTSGFWGVTHSNFGLMLFFREYAVIILAAIILTLVALESRSSWWPRYRRAVIGTGAFLFNSVVLVSIFLMILTAVVAAPALFEHGR